MCTKSIKAIIYGVFGYNGNDFFGYFTFAMNCGISK